MSVMSEKELEYTCIKCKNINKISEMISDILCYKCHNDLEKQKLAECLKNCLKNLKDNINPIYYLEKNTESIEKDEICKLRIKKISAEQKQKYYKFTYDPTNMLKYLKDVEIFNNDEQQLYSSVIKHNCCKCLAYSLYLIYDEYDIIVKNITDIRKILSQLLESIKQLESIQQPEEYEKKQYEVFDDIARYVKGNKKFYDYTKFSYGISRIIERCIFDRYSKDDDFENIKEFLIYFKNAIEKKFKAYTNENECNDTYNEYIKSKIKTLCSYLVNLKRNIKTAYYGLNDFIIRCYFDYSIYKFLDYIGLLLNVNISVFDKYDICNLQTICDIISYMNIASNVEIYYYNCKLENIHDARIYRFFSMIDNSVALVIVRDCDSFLTLQECHNITIYDNNPEQILYLTSIFDKLVDTESKIALDYKGNIPYSVWLNRLWDYYKEELAYDNILYNIIACCFGCKLQISSIKFNESYRKIKIKNKIEFANDECLLLDLLIDLIAYKKGKIIKNEILIRKTIVSQPPETIFIDTEDIIDKAIPKDIFNKLLKLATCLVMYSKANILENVENIENVENVENIKKITENTIILNGTPICDFNNSNGSLIMFLNADINEKTKYDPSFLYNISYWIIIYYLDMYYYKQKLSKMYNLFINFYTIIDQNIYKYIKYKSEDAIDKYNYVQLLPLNNEPFGSLLYQYRNIFYNPFNVLLFSLDEAKYPKKAAIIYNDKIKFFDEYLDALMGKTLLNKILYLKIKEIYKYIKS